MEEAKAKGGEIIDEEKKNLILTIISALLFLIPFVGEIAAIAAGAATIARMIAMAGLVGNAAFTIADIVSNPENAAMAIMGLLGSGRVRKPRDFAELGAARRAQTKYSVSKMGATFKKHDDSLQKILGNCRKDISKDDDKDNNICRPKRSLLALSSDTTDVHLDARLPPVDVVHKIIYTEVTARLQQRATTCNNQANTRSDSTTTTSISTYMTTPPVTCKEHWTQACYHYSSVMSVHSNTPDMVRWTCYATSGTSADGKATDDWGVFGKRKKVDATIQHHWEWAKEWTPYALCERDEWPPRAFWALDAAGSQKRGQVVRLIPKPENGGAGSMWTEFCKKHDAWNEQAKRNMRSDAATTTSQKVVSRIGGGTTTYITSVGVKVPNAVFEIKHWEHTTITFLTDDGLSQNPCWPSTLVPDDPGFALLTDDPWYRNKPIAAINTVLYSTNPPKYVTSGKTKYRTIAGRPSVAARSMDLPGSMLGNATSPVLGPTLSTIRADGPDHLVHALHIDEASCIAALRNASIMTQLLSPTPRKVIAEPSDLSVVNYI